MSSNNLTSIYATTISSENFIIINNKTIELSGNIFMKDDVTINNGPINTNSLIPNVTNSASLGSTSISWSNAYIRDVSATNIELSGNLVPLNANSSRLGSALKTWSNAYMRDVSATNIELSGNMLPLNANGSALGSGLKPWSNAYISNVSAANIELSGNIVPLNANSSRLGSALKYWSNAYMRDISATNIELSGNIVPLNANSSNLGSALKRWSNAYINDVSVTNIELSGNIVPLNANSSRLGSALKLWSNAYINDISVSNIELSGNMIPLNANRSTLGSAFKPWSNVYISDISVSNIEVSGNIVPLRDISSNLGSSLKRWNNMFAVDLSVNTINGQAYSAGGGGGTVNLTSITSNIVPSITNTYSLGSTTNYWSNAYIRDISVSNRVYQEISGDISWSTVNGYYGLAKDAYPSLNPLSSGVKAVQTWTSRVPANDDSWRDICWSPQLGLFVAVAYSGTNRVMTSSNGINWNLKTAAQLSTTWVSVCWSPELRIFVAVAEGNLTNSVMTSTDGTTWALQSAQPCNWVGVCWSPQLGIFVAVANGGSNRIMTSSNGITWIPQSQGIPLFAWYGVCWSPQLGLFVAVSFDGASRVMTSSNGTTWTPHSQGIEANNWISVCWSPELGLFVAVAYDGINNNRLMTSSNGTSWTSLFVQPNGINWGRICWSSELRIFVAVALSGQVITSPNGINWTSRSAPASTWGGVCWSPELGIFAAVAYSGNKVMTSSLKGRPPTSYNVFDSSFNSIDQTGKWSFQNIAITTTLTVNTTNYPSDDRLKHNEVVIANGLEIMERLNPKFYQKTQTMLDASYNGDLSGHTWNYEAGLIAQEVLQVPDLSFAVSGGDYYMESYNYYDTSANDLSNNDGSLTYYNRNNNYEVSYNLITQAYALNYNNIFVYGLAAIKELHAKVKAQEATLLEQQIIINSLSARMEALETGQSPETEPVTGPGGWPSAEPVPNNN